MKDLTHEDFVPLLDSEFRLVHDDAVMPLSLCKVEVTSDRPYIPEGRIPFSLLFRGPRLLAQGIYHLEHDAFGALDIFLVPVASADEEVEFQAVFT